jgi:ABC-2 type transport system ATP-binding protein
MPEIITVQNITKIYKVFSHHRGFFGAFQNLFSRKANSVRAVDGINFSIQSGELVGYLGPNGAGKSTTIKMLTGLLVPTGGEIIVDGFVPWRDRQRYVAHIGVVFGQRTTLWWDLPVIESFDLLKSIYRIPHAQYIENFKKFRQILELDPFLDTPVRSLSLGQRMRADLCAALLHDPPLLFLDEPTIGLDVVAKERIRQFIQFINQQRGVTVLLTTHDLSDVEKLCDRVLIIDQGKLLYDGKLASLIARFGGKRILVVDFAETYPSATIDGVELVAWNGLQATYAFGREDLSAADLIATLSSRFHIQDLSIQEPAIEDTIRRIYEEKLLYN